MYAPLLRATLPAAVAYLPAEPQDHACCLLSPTILTAACMTAGPHTHACATGCIHMLFAHKEFACAKDADIGRRAIGLQPTPDATSGMRKARRTTTEPYIEIHVVKPHITSSSDMNPVLIQSRDN